MLKPASGEASAIGKEVLEKYGHESFYLIVTKTGGPYTADGFKTNWQKRKYEGMDWTFYDLKAKGISDFEGDNRHFLDTNLGFKWKGITELLIELRL